MLVVEHALPALDDAETVLFHEPMSLWIYRESVDVCTWVPQSFPAALPEPVDGYTRVSTGKGESVLHAIYSQLVATQHGADMSINELLAPNEAVLHAQSFPVQLGFQITASAHALLPYMHKREETTLFPIANPLPPMAWGECALVAAGQGFWQLYTLSTTGDAGFALWEQLGALIKSLAQPMEWAIYDDFIAQCSYPGRYEDIKAALLHALKTSKGDERQAIQEQLKVLRGAQKQLLAIQKWVKHMQDDVLRHQQQWQEVRSLAKQLTVLYWQAHQERQGQRIITLNEVPLVEQHEAAFLPEEQEQLGIMRHIPENAIAGSLLVPIFDEDRAAREASLVPPAKWGKKDGVYHYQASNNLTISIMGTPAQPIPAEDAQTYLVQRSESTALTARIVMGLWNLRRHDNHLTWKGGAAIRIDEILEWRGIRKQSRPAYAGASVGSVTDGYRTDHKDQVQRDMHILSHYYIRGSHELVSRGRAKMITVSGQYLMATEITQRDIWGKQEHLLGYFVTPGDWILAYDITNSRYLAELDRRIFLLTPHNEQHELRIALYLTERWREQAHHGDYHDPITMLDLLTASVIEINRHNLTSRFIPRIEHALEQLHTRGILGAYECLDPADKLRRNWGSDWLISRWFFLPPHDLARRQIATAHSGSLE